MKKYESVLWVLVVILVGLLLVMSCKKGHAAEWQIGGGIYGLYDSATWKTGKTNLSAEYVEAHRRSEFFPSFSFEAKTNAIKLPWELWPIFKVDYQQPRFDFSDARQPTQTLRADSVSAEIGVNKNFPKYDINVYALVGVNLLFDFRINMYEVGKGWHNYHHDYICPRILFDVGMNKMFPVGEWLGVKGLKVGPEIGLKIYPVGSGFNWCRKFDTGNLMGYGGVNVWYEGLGKALRNLLGI